MLLPSRLSTESTFLHCWLHAVKIPQSILSITTLDASPEKTPYILLHDQHNDFTFHVDTASPRSLIPLHLFPDFHNGVNSSDSFAANNKPLTQVGEIDLTLSFDPFPNHWFIHTFILADVPNPILGLDFLHNNQIIIDTHSCTVSLGEPSLSSTQIPVLPNVDLHKLTLLEGLALYPNLVSGELCVNKKVHPFEHSIDVMGSPVAYRPRRYSPEKTR